MTGVNVYQNPGEINGNGQVSPGSNTADQLKKSFEFEVNNLDRESKTEIVDEVQIKVHDRYYTIIATQGVDSIIDEEKSVFSLGAEESQLYQKHNQPVRGYRFIKGRRDASTPKEALLNTYSYSIGDSVEFTPEQMKLGTQILAAYLTHMLEICKVKEEYGHPVSSESMLNEKLRDMRFVFDAVRNIEKFVGRVPDEAEIVVE